MKMFNMILWIYLGVCICFVIRIYQGFEYASDTQGSEYAWVCSWIMLEYVWICLKQNLKQLHKITSIYRYIGAFRILPHIYKWCKNECPVKEIITWSFFPKTLQYVWQGSKCRPTLNVSEFWLCYGLRICHWSP